MRRLTLSLTIAFALVLAVPAAASADTEYWGWFETRIPIARPVSLRVLSDVRIGGRDPGLGWSFLRVGPLWHLAPGFMLGTHYTAIAIQDRPDVFVQEHRAELEPNFFGRLGDFTWNDRNRLEYRWRPADQHFRYRNQLRVNYAPAGAKLIPFAWDEVLVELNGAGGQNRAEVGVGYQLTEALRFDVGGMVRTRSATWAAYDHDLVLNTYLYFAPPL